MSQVRTELKKSQWRLSKHKFLTAYHYALQYEEWGKLANDAIGISGVGYDDMPHGTNTSDPTFSQALKADKYITNMRIIEDTCMEADTYIYKWLLTGVTKEGCTYKSLRMRDGIPCGKNYYYDKRQKFYYLLSQKLEEKYCV